MISSAVAPAIAKIVTLPELRGYGAMITAVQVISVISAYSAQIKAPTGYSKFAAGQKLQVSVSGRFGMMCIYTPALLWNAYSISVSVTGGTPLVVSELLTLHFAKRVFETLFVHSYSSKMDLLVASFIGLYYTGISWIMQYFLYLCPEVLLKSPISRPGLALFTIGELGNLFHHYLLANLRSSTEDKSRYLTPKGGLFSLVVAPHYLFELIAWLGIALVARHGNAFLVFLSMASYLGGRSVATNRWYTKNIPGYPSDKKNILPFLF